MSARHIILEEIVFIITPEELVQTASYVTEMAKENYIVKFHLKIVKNSCQANQCVPKIFIG